MNEIELTAAQFSLFFFFERPLTGSLSANAGASCAAIKTAHAGSTSGVFWVVENKKAVQVYCDMSGKGVKAKPNSQVCIAKACHAGHVVRRVHVTAYTRAHGGAWRVLHSRV